MIVNKYFKVLSRNWCGELIGNQFVRQYFLIVLMPFGEMFFQGFKGYFHFKFFCVFGTIFIAYISIAGYIPLLKTVVDVHVLTRYPC